MKRLWDISPPVSTTSPLFPGDEPYAQRWTATIGPGLPGQPERDHDVAAHRCARRRPLHYGPDEATIGTLALEPYLGPAASSMRSTPARCRTGATSRMRARAATARPRPHLPAGAHRVVGRLRIVRTADDRLARRSRRAPRRHRQPVVDPPTARRCRATTACLARGLRVLENLVLDDVEAGDYELIALPLKLVEADASPVRAVLREL
jgi:arylformamidase